MTLDFLFLITGLIFLLGGGEALVRGASAIARITGLSPLVIGLTVVAFGTSAPELAVNVLAALRGSGSLSFGNIFGSNMANIGLVLGLTGLMRPMRMQSTVIFREIPMMLVASAAAIVLALDFSEDGAPGSFDRGDGLVLLLLFAVFLYYTVGDMSRQRISGPEVSLDEEGEPSRNSILFFRSGLLCVGGMGALVAGADFTVDGAVALARAFGVPEVILGLTLVAIGTSLPELATAIMATLRGHVDLAVGNVVGSNIFNILLVGGVTSLIRPIPIPDLGFFDLGFTAALSLALWWMAISRYQRLVRAEAGTLMGLYFAYLVCRSFFFPVT